jgi:hypothetical protein
VASGSGSFLCRDSSCTSRPVLFYVDSRMLQNLYLARFFRCAYDATAVSRWRELKPHFPSQVFLCLQLQVNASLDFLSGTSSGFGYMTFTIVLLFHFTFQLVLTYRTFADCVLARRFKQTEAFHVFRIIHMTHTPARQSLSAVMKSYL